jgi:hypothetical protein
MTALTSSRIWRHAAVAACVIAAPAASATATDVASAGHNAAQAQLRGRTSQGWGARIVVASSRSYVSGFAASVTVLCDAGRRRADRPMIFRGVFPIRNGRFFANVSVGDGRHYKVRGRFATARRAYGTLTYGSTRVVFGGMEVCVTPGSVRWTVSR